MGIVGRLIIRENQCEYMVAGGYGSRCEKCREHCHGVCWIASWYGASPGPVKCGFF